MHLPASSGAFRLYFTVFSRLSLLCGHKVQSVMKTVGCFLNQLKRQAYCPKRKKRTETIVPFSFTELKTSPDRLLLFMFFKQLSCSVLVHLEPPMHNVVIWSLIKEEYAVCVQNQCIRFT